MSAMSAFIYNNSLLEKTNQTYAFGKQGRPTIDERKYEQFHVRKQKLPQQASGNMIYQEANVMHSSGVIPKPG